MTVSPPTTLDSEQLCANGCGRPRASSTGTGVFVFTPKYCRDCSAVLCAVEDDRRPSREDAVSRIERDLGPLLSARTLEGFPSHGGRGEAVAQAAAWLEGLLAEASTNLFLCGPACEGKTGLAAGVARRAAAEGVRTRFFFVPDWIDQLRREQLDDSDAELAARSARLLVLDDLGSERGTPFAFERLLNVIDFRYRHKRPTIVTSNFTPGELARELAERSGSDFTGERIVSRLVENCVRVRLAYGNLRLLSEAAAA